MRSIKQYIGLLFCFIVFPLCSGYAQEHVAPLRYNGVLQNKAHSSPHVAHKTTSLNLPFFDDFTGYGVYPDESKWVDKKAYINNTMGVRPVTRGVATLDALDSNGIPYDQYNNTNAQYSDSLTSQPLDLSNLQPSDSIYLSFYYQPAGYGFAPQANDSLMLYMRKRYNDWERVWSAPGSSLQPFQQVMIPITDTIFLYNGFQFRFVNIASLNYSDAVWNIDYVRLDAGRNMYDTSVNDVAFTVNPTFLLNDYTSMPYRQFMANPNAERANIYIDSIRNNGIFPQQINYGFTATELTTNTPLHTAPISNINISGIQTQPLMYSAYNATVPLQDRYGKKVFENKYYIQSVSPADPSANDTIVKDNVFDNYLAYDDGSAEKSYYLTQSSTLPAKLAIAFHLNQPDTLQGVAIYFGRQDPPPSYKTFSLVVYNSLAGINGAGSDNVLYQQDGYTPGYSDTVNHFWIYKFNQPVPLPAGMFYIGTIQPAYSSSDSLYFGFDVNRIGNNHVYYNVLQQWSSSQLSGAVMIRPLLGQPVTGTAVTTVNGLQPHWQVTPNPATDNLFFDFTDNKPAVFHLNDIAGRCVMKGQVTAGHAIDISHLVPGMYFVSLQIDGIETAPKKIIKE